MYSRKPVKKAPAPSAITVRSRKIHRPKAKRLSMLVWLRPLTRHRPAQYRPNASMAIHGRVHNRNFPLEQRFMPRVMNSLSTGGLLSAGRPGRGGDLAPPVPLGVVVNLGLRAKFFQQAEAVGVLGGQGGLAGGVVQIAEADGAGGAGLHASGHVFAGLDLTLPGGGRSLFGGMPAAVAEVAFFHHAAHAGGDVGIERLLHAGGPLRVPPVEVARVIGAGGHTVAAAEAALGHLAPSLPAPGAL